MIESSLYQALSTAQDVASQSGGRIFPLVLPDNPTLPALDYKFISASTQGTFDGHGTAKYRLEINCWGNDYGSAVALRYAVVQHLDGLRTPDFTCRYLGPQDFFERDLKQYRALAEFYLFASI